MAPRFDSEMKRRRFGRGLAGEPHAAPFGVCREAGGRPRRIALSQVSVLRERDRRQALCTGRRAALPERGRSRLGDHVEQVSRRPLQGQHDGPFSARRLGVRRWPPLPSRGHCVAAVVPCSCLGRWSPVVRSEGEDVGLHTLHSLVLSCTVRAADPPEVEGKQGRERGKGPDCSLRHPPAV